VVARALRELERSGAIRVDRRQIQIVDARVLKEWGEGIG
jgi:DNA-binding transcriptional regulator YhcF (GntR family)